MLQPKISLELDESPKAHTQASERLIHCIMAANAGAWKASLKIPSKARHLVHEIAMKLRLADDGHTPIALTIKVSLTTRKSDGTCEFEQSFQLNQFADKEPQFLMDSVEEFICNNVLELLRRKQQRDFYESEEMARVIPFVEASFR